jgi:hypothetical protein
LIKIAQSKEDREAMLTFFQDVFIQLTSIFSVQNSCPFI